METTEPKVGPSPLQPSSPSVQLDGTSDSQLMSGRCADTDKEHKKNRGHPTSATRGSSSRHSIIDFLQPALDDDDVLRLRMNGVVGSRQIPGHLSPGSHAPNTDLVPGPVYPRRPLHLRPLRFALQTYPGCWRNRFGTCLSEEFQLPPSITLRDLQVESDLYYLDVVDEFSNMQLCELAEQLSFSRGLFMCSSHPWRYKAVVRGKIDIPGFVSDPDGKIWYQFGTSRFIILYNDPFKYIACQATPSEDPLEARLGQLLVLVLNTMFRTSAGTHNPTSDPLYSVSVRSIIVLQTIREMLHWRKVLREALSELPPNTKCTLDYLGQFSVTAQHRLSYENDALPDLRYLDSTNWKDPSDYVYGLLVWLNISLAGRDDPAQLLQSINATKCDPAHWAYVALQFGGERSLDQALAFVGLIRFLVIRHHVPATSHPSLFCANEFLDRAMAIPELEACVPELLNLQDKYQRGYDIETGAVTAVDFLDQRRRHENSRFASGKISSCLNAIFPSSPSTAAGIGLRGLPNASDRRVVMSVWTSPINGDEWKVPQTVRSSLDFKIGDIKYRLAVNDGYVTCKRVGFLKRLKDQLKSVTHIQTPFLGIQRECTGSTDPEASGSVAISNALALAYGKEACLHMVSWLHRGVVNVSPNCTVASFVPRSSHGCDVVVNQKLGYEICRQMVFGRCGHELYWLPGEGLPCFRVRDCPNGTYQVVEVEGLPAGVELCTAELTKDFG